MPNVKIKDLSSLESLNPQDSIAIQSGNITYHVTIEKLKEFLLEDVLKRLDALENTGQSGTLSMLQINSTDATSAENLGFFPANDISVDISGNGRSVITATFKNNSSTKTYIVADIHGSTQKKGSGNNNGAGTLTIILGPGEEKAVAAAGAAGRHLFGGGLALAIAID